jgi:hypothetical protein
MASKSKGRPRKKAPRSGERVALGLRVTSDLKVELDKAAKRSGRSQSQEAELRIEQTFADQRSVLEILALTYGRELSGLMLVLGEVMRDTGAHAGFMSTFTADGAQSWWNNPYAYDQAKQAARMILDVVAPDGTPTPPAMMTGIAAGLNMASIAENLGEGFAQGLLREIASPEPIATTAIERAPRLRKALGTLADRIQSRIGG